MECGADHTIKDNLGKTPLELVDVIPAFQEELQIFILSNQAKNQKAQTRSNVPATPVIPVTVSFFGIIPQVDGNVEGYGGRC